jgi:hypothetical protein
LNYIQPAGYAVLADFAVKSKVRRDTVKPNNCCWRQDRIGRVN